MRSAKRHAADRGQTLTQFIEDSLREKLARQAAPPPRRAVMLPSFEGEGLQPGVDLADSASLLELMDDADAAARR